MPECKSGRLHRISTEQKLQPTKGAIHCDEA